MENKPKVLFIHSYEKMKSDDEFNLYTDGSYNEIVWKRYLNISEYFTFISRKDKKIYSRQEALSKYNYFDIKKMGFISIEDRLESIQDYISISKYYKNKNIIKEAIKSNDIIIIRMPCDIANIAIKYAKKFNKKYIIELVGCPVDSLWNHSIKGKIMMPISYVTTKNLVRNAKYVIYVSRHFLQNRYPTKGFNVGCPDVVLDTPKEEILEKRINKIKNMKNHEITLGLIGSLDVNYRGHETIIKAIAELNKRNINCRVKFLGGGNSSRWISLAKKYNVDNQIEFCGTLPSGKPVLEWIDDIDILTMPTQQETLGRAIIEAMSRACPVIGSIETAISEQIGSDCLCKAKDFYKLADIIEKMKNDNEYMMYCAKENFYRSFKYINSQSDKIRRAFYKTVLENDIKKQRSYINK